jgi:glycosyltransferase involved in cell wall biosynthesis
MKLLSYHLTGNANVKAAMYGLIEAGMLGEFYVAFASIPGSGLDRLGAIGPFSEIRRRRFDPIIKPYLHTWPWFEIGRIVALKAGLKKLTQPKTAPFYIDGVVQNLDKYVANQLVNAQKNGVDAVYGYEDTALFAFRKAKLLGLQCIYDLPIGYWRSAHKLLDIERQRWPGWMDTMPGLEDSIAKLSRKDEELKLADRIFVASTFTANTLKDYKDKLAPIEVIPYGFPPVDGQVRNYQNFKNARPLKLLFVGSLSQRKGIADLFEAVKCFGQHVTLTLVGSKTTENCLALNEALARHRWIPSMAHNDVLRLMRESDVLVFPSLFEGFGLVITEAMSQGTPVITTERTAGPDLIDHGENGWLIEAGSTLALKRSIEELLLQPERIKEVGIAAMEKARLRPWEMYGNELATAIKKSEG